MYLYMQDTAKLLYTFLNAKVKSTFHKLNIHAGKLPNLCTCEYMCI